MLVKGATGENMRLFLTAQFYFTYLISVLIDSLGTIVHACLMLWLAHNFFNRSSCLSGEIPLSCGRVCLFSTNLTSRFLNYQHSTAILPWHHNERDVVSNHQPHNCLLNRLFRRRSKKTSKLRITGLCEGNWPVTGEFTRTNDQKHG